MAPNPRALAGSSFVFLPPSLLAHSHAHAVAAALARAALSARLLDGFLQSRVLALCVVLLRANHCWVACGLEISKDCLVCVQSPPKAQESRANEKPEGRLVLTPLHSCCWVRCFARRLYG